MIERSKRFEHVPKCIKTGELFTKWKETKWNNINTFNNKMLGVDG